VSGQFRDITREKMEEFIKKNGGNMVALVNKKTDYLIVGHILDDGRQPSEGKKYQMAVKLGKKVMTEGEFESFCKIKF
jgi:NAD-dependent DNA ligase